MSIRGNWWLLCRVGVVGGFLGGVGGLAHAQGSVTLYGIVDTGILYTSKTLNAQTGGNSGRQFSLLDSGLSGSRFGIKGVEDLGSGLRAAFDLESGINTTNGGLANSNGNLFGRQAWVGLSGGFGSVKAGVQYSPFALAAIDSDARDISYFGSGAVNYIANVYTTGLFASNAISYTSPVIAGLQGSAMLALGGQAGNFQAGRQYSARLNYNLSGLSVNAALFSGNAGGTAATTPVPSTVAFTGRMIGAGYKFGSLTVKASFTNYKLAGSFDNRVYGGGFSYAISSVLDVDAGVWFTSDGNDTTNHSIMAAAGTKYYLSKRTTLYGQVGVVNNHGNMNSGLSINDGVLHEVAGTTTGVNVGIRHTF
ncbi:porin [Paraburkholderia megapolitana]